MATNNINAKVKVTSDGSLKKVKKDAEGAAKAMGDLGRASNRYNKTEKGAAGLGANSTKGFAKMAQSIQGGLVPAYATLAANVFALSAAFNFFSRAADYGLLRKSQESFAASTGIGLQTITSELQRASDGMLGFKEAAQAAAIGVAKGFSPKQMQELAEGARKASAALGRDFQDSFDRLVRGASKAEPELLDELGITLRLADATARYAQANNLSVKSLTASQRSQAVLIETQRQLNELYGESEAGTNAFTKLAKTFDRLVNTGVQAVLPFFEGFANFLSRSAVAAITVFGALGLSILKAMIPLKDIKQGFADWESKQTATLEKAKAQMEQYKQKIREVANEQRNAATASLKTSARGMLANGVGANSALIQKAAKGQLTDPKQIGQLKAMLKKAEAEWRLHGSVRNGHLAGANLAMIENMKRSLGMMGKTSYTFWEQEKLAITKWELRAKVAFNTVKVAAVGAFKAIGGAAKMAMTAINGALRFAGFIGIAMMVWDLVKSIAKSPLTIAEYVFKALDFIFNAIFKAIGYVGGAVGTVIDTIGNGWAGIINMLTGGLGMLIRGAGKLADGVANIYRDLFNTLADGWNWIADSAIGKRLGLGTVGTFDKEITLFSESAAVAASSIETSFSTTSTAVGDAMSSVGEWQSNTGAVLDAIKYNGKSLRELGTEWENNQKAIEKAKQALEDYKTTLESTEKDLDNTAKGLAAIDRNSKLTNFQKNMKKGEIIAKSLASTGLADKLREALGMEGEFKTKALDALIEKTGSLGTISKEAAEAIRTGNVAALEALQKAGTEATAAYNSLKDMAQSAEQAVMSGDWQTASNLIGQMERETKLAVEQFNRIGGPEGHAAAQMVQTFYEKVISATRVTSEWKDKIDALIDSMHNVTMEETAANLLGSERAKVIQAQIELQKILNEEKDIGLQIDKAYADQNYDKVVELERLEKEIELRKQVAAAKLQAASGGAFAGQAASVGVLATQAGADGNISLSDMHNVASPMLEELRKLSPQGEALSAAIEGSFTMAEAWQDAFKVIGDTGASSGDKIKAGLQAGLATMNALQNMMAAKSKAAVDGVDKEIAAEKARDGKSKESLARIAQLEKKKDNIKRKAFEMDKKMKMAQIVMSTALAAMQAAAAPPGLPFTAPMVAMVIAMGAAQLAAVASTSYQGGASGAAAASAPSSISVGERKSSTDFAKSKGAAGELSYFRGASGTGGPESFRPAFTGATIRPRATGGATTAYMVGEKGPELFVPERPGRVVSNSEVGQGAGTVNANITISAVDADGVEEVLTRQRGNIIRMLRDAANANGETFLESVSTASL